jgi:hypothetical protein
MKINKLSAVGGIGGSALMLSSWLRYFVMYPDLDKAIIYGVVGGLIIAVSYLWDKQVQTNNTLYSVEEWLAAQNKSDDDEE